MNPHDVAGLVADALLGVDGTWIDDNDPDYAYSVDVRLRETGVVDLDLCRSDGLEENFTILVMERDE